MIVDGKKIAEEIYAEIKKRIQTSGLRLHLTVVTSAPNLETKKYLTLKQNKAEEVGIDLSIVELAADATTDDVIANIDAAARKSSGVLVQFPLPSPIDPEAVVRAIPLSHDIDALNPETASVLPPVVGAFKEILSRHHVEVKDKLVTILGSGRLVGQPSVKWFTSAGAHVSVVVRETKDIAFYTRQADIIVCGAGDPGFLKPDMVKEGVVILDAGTSEEGGVLRGDADPLCAEKAALFTPVPGGVGPITIAVLLRNLIDLSS
jgi:methylenetetrahydrofolate dehydrogenase (NADP+) / methenyltetrahydrofolate cyclohydrolase